MRGMVDEKMRGSNEPDWDFWLVMPEVKLWEATALSMNMDPHKMEPSKQPVYYSCRRCGKKKELRLGKTTGNNKARYLALKDRLNKSGVLAMKRSADRYPLCL